MPGRYVPTSLRDCCARSLKSDVITLFAALKSIHAVTAVSKNFNTDRTRMALLWPPYVMGGPLYFCPVVTIFLSIYLFFLA